jgi:hypothetical protein
MIFKNSPYKCPYCDQKLMTSFEWSQFWVKSGRIYGLSSQQILKMKQYFDAHNIKIPEENNVGEIKNET